ncbi:hypothetical protein Daud_0778 [Candidatus Desulforudis audaxviator MP104C]|uniref:Big-1 domain-containing protein n=1 Tax=Desulforudis audaxviator (strain MP104C) TaxID=477974 RepID=B1I2T1_DESAP|nr:hypothetical protein [Candidatus Desulforudis audaxviator]ACA59300.1 hypothetical protein Daud_0778 [Candidatus Desulforudis audaxviator MP104C]
MNVIGLSKSAKRARKVISILAVFSLLLTLVPAMPAMAAAQSVGVTAGSDKAGAATSYVIGFTCTSQVYSGDQLAVIFPSAFGDANAAVDKVTVNGTVYSFSPQRQAAGMWILYYTGSATIPASVQYAVYFSNIVNPTTAATYQITARAPYPADTGTQGSITIGPADPVKLVINGLSDEDQQTPGIQVTAGKVQNLVVRLADRYGNVGAVNNMGKGISVKLTDTDPQANFGNDEGVTLTIDQGQSQSSTLWTPKTAGTVTITATDVTENPNPQMQAATATVQVRAAGPAKILLDGPSYLNKDAEGTYTVSLKDSYDNPASVANAVYIDLTATPGDGVTFTPNQVRIPAGQNTGTFKFKSSQANMYTIGASSTGLALAEKKVAVGVTVLAELAITAPQTGEVGIASEIAIALKDQFGNAFAAPEGGVEVTLLSDETGVFGVFYDAPANGKLITSVTIPKGQSSVKVYYVPGIDAVGAHKLTFTAPQVLSDGRPTNTILRAEATINVQTGAELWLVVTPLNFTAGERGGVTITVRDAHGNPVPAGQNDRVVQLETNSPTGKFYAAATGGNPITQVTIPAGQSSVTVHYVDTESWTKKALEDGKLSAAGLNPAGYSYTVAFRSEGVIGFTGKAIVNPVAASAITLDVAQQDVDAVSDEEYTQIGSRIGATDLIGVAYMRVGVVDRYGNPVPQQALLTISVKDDSPSAFLWWDYARLEGGEWADEHDAWLVVTAPGTYNVTASAGGFAAVSKQVVFEQPSLVVEAPTAALPDTRERVTVKLTNLWASGRDLVVDLATSTENSAFYATSQTATPITKATIPAYRSSVIVYLESDDPLGTAVELTARIADLNLTAKATVTLGRGPDGSTLLLRGWNIISTPWVLADGRDTIDQILANPEYIEQAWGYKDGRWYQVTTADPESMKLRPLEALYVKVKGETWAVSWAQSGLGTPPVRSLPAGWNLVGNPEADRIAADAALASIAGSYAVVISPAGCNQGAWVYTPPMGPGGPAMKPFRGYWVYMRQGDTLAGLAMPPVQ